MADKKLNSLRMAGLPDRYVVPSSTDALRVTITQSGGALTADKKFAELFVAHEAGQTVVCKLEDGSVLSLVSVDAVNAAMLFQSENGSEYQQIVIKAARPSVTYKRGTYGATGGLNITDDGNGNVTIAATGGIRITDDGNGNVTIA